MSTIADRVRSWIRSHPSHAAFLAQGLMNASALARMIKPEIDAKNNDDTSIEAIILALNRYSKNITSRKIEVHELISDVSTQSDLSIMTIPHADLNADAFSTALSILHKTSEFTLYTRGAWHISLIGRQPIVEELRRHFRHTTITHDVAAITMRLVPEHTSIPGVSSYILQKIAFSNITVHEIVSSHNELTLVVNNDNINKALDCLEKSK